MAPPEGPVVHVKDKDEGEVSVSLVAGGKFKYADDIDMPRKHEMAREKYAPLIRQLAEAGWRVNDRLATVVVGHRAHASPRRMRTALPYRASRPNASTLSYRRSWPSRRRSGPGT